MNTTIKNISVITALFLFTITANADNTNNSGLLGNYQCQRVDASNNTNSYPLVITANGSTYTFEWDNASGYPAFYGTGIIDPNRNNIVSVIYSDPKTIINAGVELFEIKSDGSLQATWARRITTQVGSETCTKSK